jgi:hypothetical protein
VALDVQALHYTMHGDEKKNEKNLKEKKITADTRQPLHSLNSAAASLCTAMTTLCRHYSSNSGLLEQ